MDEKFYEVMQKAAELSETCLEGLEYIKTKLEEGQYEKTIPMLINVLNAFYTMEKSLSPIVEELQNENITKLSERLRDNFDFLITQYQMHDINKVADIIELRLLPNYKRWQKELYKSCKPYLN